MFTLLNCLHDLLSHILEEHFIDVPSELFQPFTDAMKALEGWLEKNSKTPA